MSKLLINESPLQVLPSLAVAIGLNEAIFLQQLHFWLTPTAKYKPHYRIYKGVKRPWIYNTYHVKETKGGEETGWRSNFPFWSDRTIKRIVNNLRNMDLIITTDEFNERNTNRTLWYTIDYDVVRKYETVVTVESDNLSPSDSDNLSPSRHRLQQQTTTDIVATPVQAPKQQTTQTLTDLQKDELLLFGKHPNGQYEESFDTIQEIRNAGWEIRNPVVEQGIVYYIEVVRQKKPSFAIPNDNSVRKDWYKAVNGHLADYRIDDLKRMYELVIEKFDTAKLPYTRPGSLTKTLPEFVEVVDSNALVAQF